MKQSSKSSNRLSQPSLQPSQLAFSAIGTWWQIDVSPGTVEPDLGRIIHERIAAFDEVYSRFKPHSWLSDLSRSKGVITLPTDAEPLFTLYKKMYQLTGGLVTPFIGQVLSDAGYDATYSLRPGILHRPPSWDEVLVYESGDTALTLLQPALFDFGAAGKGYLVDIVSDLLESGGVTAYCVDAGGDMRQRQPKATVPMRVGMENPDDPSQVVGIVNLANQSLCGSAGNRRKWAGFHHIMDPHTLRPAQDVKAVWVVAETTMIADAMATCLFFTSGDLLQQHFDFSYTIIYSDNSYFVSSGFPGELFI